MNPDSLWMFDWGDGTTSDWLQLENNETSISQTHRWNDPGTYQLHVKFQSETAPYGVWSDAKIVEITPYTSADFPNKPILRTGKIQGYAGYEYSYSAVAIDPHGAQICYRFDYNNEILSEWTSFVPSGSVSYLPFIWERPGVYSIRVQARNQYGLESLWSDSVQVTIKDPLEDAGVSVDLIVLNDVNYHILFSSNVSGTFYNSSAGVSNDVYWNGDGTFLLDDDNDGRWEYLYTPALGDIQPYQGQLVPQSNILSEIPWLLILIVISITVIVIGVVIILIKKGYIYVYEEEVVVEK
jgi:hypothetical protein